MIIKFLEIGENVKMRFKCRFLPIVQNSLQKPNSIEGLK